MSTTTTIQFPAMKQKFKAYGFTEAEIETIVAGLVTLWRCNELFEDITREVIFSELDLDEITAQSLWNDVCVEIIDVAAQIRSYSTRGVLIRWVSFSYAVMLELEDENVLP